MSRNSWAAVVMLSVLVTGGAAFYLTTQKERFIAVPQTAPAALPVQPPSPPAPQDPAPPVEPVGKETVSEVRNILFRLSRPKAKSIAIIGDFNQWKRQKLVKNEDGKTWQLTIPLKPGAYKYQYVIDDRRVRDPNNKTVQDGKSVIVVKPLTPQ